MDQWLRRKYKNAPMSPFGNRAVDEASTGICYEESLFMCESTFDEWKNEHIIPYGDIYQFWYIPALEPEPKERYFLIMSILNVMHPFWWLFIEAVLLYCTYFAVVLLLLPKLIIEDES